jgi:HAD superfamily hydrolase (TIGR01490 family)
MVAAAPVVALFDMDRTLIDTHTAKLYVRFQRDLGEIGVFDTLRTTYWLLQYTFGVIDAKQVALRVSQGYRGKSNAWLNERCQRWFQSHVRERISSIGRARVREHLKSGHAVAIATSAVRQVAEPLARELSIPYLVCSELEVRDGELTGSFNWPLCYGEGKLERARALVHSLDARLEQTAFYTDSITDLPLLEAVGHPMVVNPDARLRRAAKRRGWLIEDWIATAAAERLLNRQEAKVAKQR